MKIIGHGWSRNCGTKTIIRGNITDKNIGNTSKPIYMGDIYVRVLSSEDDEQGVEITFGTEVQLGGRHFVRQRLSQEELFAMLDACTRPPARPSNGPALRIVQ